MCNKKVEFRIEDVTLTKEGNDVEDYSINPNTHNRVIITIVNNQEVKYYEVK